MLAAEALQLELACSWADTYGCPDEGAMRVLAGAERKVSLGGEGTPEVGEFAAAEFGMVQEMHPIAATHLIADALDLRHRFPRLWEVVRSARLRCWVARKIASVCRHLSFDQARYVDAAVAPYAESLPPSRLLALVEAKAVETDPAGAEARREAAAARRFVELGRRDADGLRTLILRANAGDAIWFAAMCDRLAAVLQLRGDTDPVDVRRSKAVGLLARPAEALQLLLEAERSASDDECPLDPEVPTQSSATALPEAALELLDAVDPARLRPQARLYFHLAADGVVARAESAGRLTLGGLNDALRGCHVTVKPVVHLAERLPVDGYEFPARLMEASRLRTPPDRPRQLGADAQTPPPDQDPPARVGAPTTRAGQLCLAIPARALPACRPLRHPPPRPDHR